MYSQAEGTTVQVADDGRELDACDKVFTYLPEEKDEGGYTLYKATASYESDTSGDLSFEKGDILRVTDEGTGADSWMVTAPPYLATFYTLQPCNPPRSKLRCYSKHSRHRACVGPALTALRGIVNNTRARE